MKTDNNKANFSFKAIRNHSKIFFLMSIGIASEQILILVFQKLERSIVK